MYVSVAIVRSIIDALKARGISIDRFCADAGFDAARLADGTSMIPVTEYARLALTSLRLSNDPAFGLHIGVRAPNGALHAVGYLLLNCETIRDAIGEFIRLAGLVYEQARWELREDADHALFSYEHAVPGDQASAFDAEFCLAFILGVGRHYIGRDASPIEVHFSHPAPDHADEYRRVFGCPVEFGRPRNQILFARAALDKPQLHRDEALAQLLRARAESLLAERASDAYLRQRVIDVMKYQPDDPLDADAVARRLGLSPRSLRRRLAAAGDSLSSLAIEARTDLARRALAGHVPIKEIAERLGFSEVSAFHRAFKRWTGLTPAQYRRTMVTCPLGVGLPDAG